MGLAPTVQPKLRGLMLAYLRRPAAWLGVLAGLAAVYACSLNPQPLPPGAAPEGGGAAQVAADATVPDSGSASFGGSGDGGPRADAATDAEAPPSPAADAGDAASDATADGPNDAASDSPEEAPTDGGSEDGE